MSVLLPSESFVLDANIFIQAHRKFYPFDICPGYWEALCWYRREGHICSVDKVRDELQQGKDILWKWIEKSFGKDAFDSTESVMKEFDDIVNWVKAHSQFTDEAKSQFMKIADGWLVAHAQATGKVIVTLEVFNRLIRKKIPIPNLAGAFGVKTIDLFEMLRRLDIRFGWEVPY